MPGGQDDLGRSGHQDGKKKSRWDMLWRAKERAHRHRKDQTITMVGQNAESAAAANQNRAQSRETPSVRPREAARAPGQAGGAALPSSGRGATEVEVKERKDRVDARRNATRAAVEEGIVAGRRCALCLTRQGPGQDRSRDADQKAGIQIVRKALSRRSKSPKNSGR